MKAERRHELQTNTLAQFITDLPLYLRFHINKILFGIIVVCLIILLMRYRHNQAQLAHEATKGSLESARMGIENLRSVDRAQKTDAARAAERNKIAAQIRDAARNVLENTTDAEDAATRAQAYLVQGDLAWTLANLPPLPGAATQPQLAPRETSAQYLDDAANAYQQVLKNYPDQMVPKANALMSLATIEENRGNWDKAISYYNQVVSDEKMAKSFKDLARQKLAMVPLLRTPIYLGTYSATQPSTQPATATAKSIFGPMDMTIGVTAPPATAPAAAPKMPDFIAQPTTNPTTQP